MCPKEKAMSQTLAQMDIKRVSLKTKPLNNEDMDKG